MPLTTEEWLHSKLTRIPETDERILRSGRLWKPVAGFSSYGCIFCVYQDTNHTTYCAHSGEEWEVNQAPSLGFFNGDLSWEDLVCEISKKYDSIRANLVSV